MSLLEELKTLGVNVDEGLERLGGNEALYTRLLGSLTSTIEEYYVQPDFDGADYAAATERAHAIKGTAGNLSITPVYEAYTEIVSLLREGKPEEARVILKKILPIQEEIIRCIERSAKGI